MRELAPISEIVKEIALKIPRFRRKSHKCANNHHRWCKGVYRSNHGESGPCQCPCHSAVETDPNL